MRASRSAQEGFPEKVTTGAQHENKPEGGKEGERVVGRERMHRPPKGWEHGKRESQKKASVAGGQTRRDQ